MRSHHFCDESVQMRVGEIKDLVQGTNDSAFAVDGAGLIVAWNSAAEEMFGLTAKEAIGKACGQVLQGIDECGTVCSRDCTVRQAIRNHHPLRNFDLQIQTQQGMQWCNLSVLIAEEAHSSLPYSIHIVRPIDVPKKLELLMRNFVRSETKLSAEKNDSVTTSARSPIQHIELTPREQEILRMLAKGATTATIAGQLHISRTTVNNHIQHIHQKLNTHTRLEAVRRAELAGVI